MKNLNYSLVVALLFLVLSLNLFSQPFGKGMIKNDCRLFNKLDLTSDQKESLETLRYEHRLKVTDLHSKLDINRLKIDRLFSDEKINKDEILELNEENNEIHNELSDLKMKMKIEMSSILTADQREKINEVGMFKRHKKSFRENFRKGNCKYF